MVYTYYPNRRGLLEQISPPLESHHYFPRQVDLNIDHLKRGLTSSFKISRSTPIASIGSCFAREIRNWLIEHQYHFLQTAIGPGTGAGSARYDRVYSTFGIRQEFERAFASFEPLTPYWEIEEGGEVHLLDPYRYTIAWESHAERERESEEHRDAVRRAFTEAEVVIITVGQGEIWYDVRDQSVFPVLPPLEVYDPELHHFRCSTYQENLDNLRRCRALLFEHNPSARIIITTSPVPLKLTFSGEGSITANCAMKSMLRAVVDAFVKESDERVSYFPAYEVVTLLAPDPFTDDARHVTRETVELIMGLFESTYIDSERTSAEEASSSWLKTAIELRRSQDWGLLMEHLESIKRTRSLSDADQLNVLDLYGEACLRAGRHEDAYGLLLRARELGHRLGGEPISTVKQRLNYLIALLYQEDDDALTYQICLELSRCEGYTSEMILMWLQYLQKRDPLNALNIGAQLMEESLALSADPEVSTWLQGLLNQLESSSN